MEQTQIDEFLSQTGRGTFLGYNRGTSTALLVNDLGTSNYGELHIMSQDNDAVKTIQMTVKSTGEVGIGTTEPTDKLHVIGSVLFDGSLNIIGNINYTSTSNDEPLLQSLPSNNKITTNDYSLVASWINDTTSTKSRLITGAYIRSYHDSDVSDNYFVRFYDVTNKVILGSAQLSNIVPVVTTITFDNPVAVFSTSEIEMQVKKDSTSNFVVVDAVTFRYT